MELEYRVGNSKHFASRWIANKLPPNAVRHGLRWFGSSGEQYGGRDMRSIVAYRGKTLVGLFRFTYDKPLPGKVRLRAEGTWVAPDFRRVGVPSRSMRWTGWR